MDPELQQFLFEAFDAAETAASALFAAIDWMKEDGYSEELIAELEGYEETLGAIGRRLEDIRPAKAA